MKNIKHIDCTLRDGGYYNSWNFDERTVKNYLECMQNLNMDFVEFGFRFLKDTTNLGPFASTTEKLISKFKIPKKLKLAVMINIGEFSILNLENELDKLFLNKKKSRVSLVRIASHKNEIELAVKASKILKKKGYLTAINLMQITEINLKSLKIILSQLNKSFLDFFYFADSLGSLTQDQTKSICVLIKKYWKGPFGIHAHDNTEIALFNTITALQNGAKFADSTVLGMGRGPGNVKTELLCSYLNSVNAKKYNLVFLTDTVDKYFTDLKKKFKWGTNLYYYLSAKYKIHPTYIQYMLSDKRYEENELILAIENLKKQKCKTYNPSILKDATKFFNTKKFKNINVKKFYNKKILILANSESLNLHKNKIEKFIKKNKPLIISLNSLKNLKYKIKVDFLAICHPTRIISEINSISSNTKLITPFSSFEKNLQKLLTKYKKINYGLIVKEKSFAYFKSHCILDKAFVLPYVLSLMTACEVKSIYLAGFDGYKNNPVMRKEHNKIFNKFNKMNFKKPFKFLTPSLFKIKST